MAGAPSRLARAVRDRSRGHRGGREVSALSQGRGPAVRAGPDGHVQAAALGTRLRMGALLLRRAHAAPAHRGGGLDLGHCERSEAIQLLEKTGLLRRSAPRNDGPASYVADIEYTDI